MLTVRMHDFSQTVKPPVACVRACVGQCATKRRRKMPIITDRADEEALTRRTGSGGVAQLLHFLLRAVDACTVNVHKKNLPIVNQAVVTFVRVSRDFVGGFSHAGTSSLSLECRHAELRGFLSSLNFLFSTRDFYPPPPFNMWSSESDYSTAPVLVPFPCFPGSSSLALRHGAFIVQVLERRRRLLAPRLSYAPTWRRSAS